MIRFGAFGGTLLALVLARSTTSLAVVAGTLAVSVGILVILEPNRRSIAAWVAYALAFVGFIQLRALADETGIAVKYDYVISADRALFGGALPSSWLQAHLTPTSIEPLAWVLLVVYGSYFIVPHVVALVLLRRNFGLFRRYAAAVLAVGYAGVLAALVLPTAPPWLAGAAGHTDGVSRVGPLLLGHGDGSAYQRGSDLAGLNPVAAFPSLHTAVTAVLVLAAWGTGRRVLRSVALAYTCVMGFALVYLGEHYVIDVAAGICLAAGAWAVVTQRAHRPATGRWLPARLVTPVLARRS